MKRRAFVAISLAACLLALPGVSSTTKTKEADEAKRQAKLFQKKLNKDDQILHALDRLTFGPRPGDLATVKKMGLKKWIDQQLHPEQIKESPELEAKLLPLESLRMTPLETVQHYPPQQLIRAIAEGRQPMPDDPLLRASVERLIARYKTKKDADASGKNGAAANPNADMEPAKSLDEVLDSEQLQTMRAGTPEKKRDFLASLPADKLEDVLIAMPRGQRQQFFNFASTEIRRKVLLMNA